MQLVAFLLKKLQLIAGYSKLVTAFEAQLNEPTWHYVHRKTIDFSKSEDTHDKVIGVFIELVIQLILVTTL
ncbi:hypothetical protein [Vibrio jasicida]|uniref:hypothetical protein n=1 Tax=Vibrio jasicida TaxID=766224 RepID=UPI004068F8A0